MASIPEEAPSELCGRSAGPEAAHITCTPTRSPPLQEVRIHSMNGDAILMPAEDYDAWQETVYLLRSPANARRLMEAVARDRAGQTRVTQSLEEFQGLAGDE
ncbi:type II toxin-antitoxin system Phd/YefM family antitoxin [Streptomyces prunicolor]|uniref:type II toxin-antitoxin system Phd/YefM family antitoxin n=1 Tax=Streptomyces prunicolor TaxID=67348 RepID=UPI000998C55E